jgi:hypothetical protein
MANGFLLRVPFQKQKRLEEIFEEESVVEDFTIPPESADLTNQKVIVSIEIAVFAEQSHAEIMRDIEAAIKEMKRLNLKFSYESRSYLSVSGEQLKCYALDFDAMSKLQQSGACKNYYPLGKETVKNNIPII